MKKILITGAGSYIGTSFEKYLRDNYPGQYETDTVDMTSGTWREKSFSGYDSIFHVAGIAHSDSGKISPEKEKLYYAVNTDLTVETAKKAKADGAKQFIFMSSAIVYGDSAPIGKTKLITRDTPVSPSNCYGDSKVKAEEGIRPLQDEGFNVVILRPPMIYGRGSKGNYPLLSKIAQRIPFFPYVKNERSMLYIENLCEFVRLMIENRERGTFWPQNAEYSNTSELVRMIGEAHGRKMILIKGFVGILKLSGCFTGLADKAFGSLDYEQDMSTYKTDYHVCSLQESVVRTERTGREHKKVLFLVNHDVVIYNFRLEIVERLLADGYEVHISSPYGERIESLIQIGAKYHEIFIDRHSMNLLKDQKILRHYKKLMKIVQPSVVLGFTIKPNIYGAIAAKKRHIPFIANITGLGTALEGGGWKQRILTCLYRYAFTDLQTVFFQNTENQNFFKEKGIAIQKQKLLPGSGVNLERFPLLPYPEGTTVRFAFISRIMKEKGIDQYLEAARAIKKRHNNVEFHVCGFCEPEYDGRLQEEVKRGTVIYHGLIRDVAGIMGQMHCIVHPTYYPEGISNVLLEGCAIGRPIITTGRSGCREVVEDGVNGYVVKEKNSEDLTDKIEKFLNLSWENKRKMGLYARKKVEREFDRKIVVEKYMKEIDACR